MKFHFKDGGIRSIAYFAMSGATINTVTWDDESRFFLGQFLVHKVMTHDEIIAAIKERLRVLAHEGLRMKSKVDHLPSQEVMAYAIYHGLLSDKEVESMEFDHGDTRDTLIHKHYVENFPEKILDQLLGR